MLNYERDPAIRAAGTAADIAERLGLVETRTNARITVAMSRYQAGDRAGLDELRAVTQFCRANQLLALPRAIQNLAYAVLEEGDWIHVNALLAAASADAAEGSTLATGYSTEAMRAYFDGEFGKFLVAADAFVDTPSGRWDMHVRGLRACLRVLRDEPVPAGGGDHPHRAELGTQPDDDITEALETARRSGFHRVHWNSLGLGALCRALQGRRAEADELLTELADSWLAVPALPSGEWTAAAACAAALVGRGAAERVRDMLAEVGHRTPWAEAALRMVTGAVAGHDGDHARAGQLYTAAAEIYARIPNLTDRMLSLALAANALARAGDHGAAQVALAEVRTFALRNQAPGLLRLGRPPYSAGGWSPVLAS
jgi:hypothetical protein